jgi:hypothetical protein
MTFDKSSVVDCGLVVVAIILIVNICIGCFMLNDLFTRYTKGQDCQIEVQFNDSKATYIGKTI